ncbi:MAG: hypothetical protein CMB11_09455 [Euryarchaeota archaeon]|nr:hypothetical protein [Euryarchaeota archaeon]MBD40568.1 hypothetical protein [Euryarchaeota archaeon]|tara:strand:- start:34 stop:735 length:702 start_codon:yes stop_codon:yes gene_type:complete
MPRSLQDVLRAGAEHSRANAPRVLQTRLEREEEIREENRRIRNARNIPEAAKEVKHAWNRLWEETGNEVDFVRGARDCYAEREDLWRQVEGMDALRETSNVYKKLYEDLLKRHRGILGRLESLQNDEELKARVFKSNANEAQAMGNMEDAEDFNERMLKANDMIQMFNYIMYRSAYLPPEPPEPQAGERLDQERLEGMRRNQERAMQRNADRVRDMEERPYQNEGEEVGKVGW